MINSIDELTEPIELSWLPGLVSFFIRFYNLWLHQVSLIPLIIDSIPSPGARGKDKREEDAEEPYITAYLHSHDQPNEFNCTDRKRITLSMTRGQDLDHRKYTFFLSPE